MYYSSVKLVTETAENTKLWSMVSQGKYSSNLSVMVAAVVAMMNYSAMNSGRENEICFLSQSNFSYLQ